MINTLSNNWEETNSPNHSLNSKILWGNGVFCHQEIPKIIWIYWDSEVLPPLVHICIEQLYRLLPRYDINIINNQNLHKYLPNIPKKREDLPLANYSDLVRLFLLREYGGIWMDASILLTENLDWIYRIKQEDQSDLVGFYSEHFTSDKEYPLLETWFIATSPQNKFITAWASEFEKCYTSENPHRYFDEEKKNSSFLQKIDEPLSNYLIAYLAAAKIMRNNQDFRLSMISANDIGHYYNFRLQLKPHQLQEVFLYKKESPSYIPPLIKFEKKGRMAIDEALDRGHYTKRSLLFRIVSQENYYLQKIAKLPKYYVFLIQNMIKKFM